MIVVTGATGYVGTAMCRELDRRGMAYLPISRSQIDYYNRSEMRELLRDQRATLLVNAAGYTGKPNVDACEIHKTECLDGNATLPGVLKEVCAEAGVVLGHVSSGCIYNGEKPDGSGFTESDPPNFSFRTNNCSFYSGTKALGEELLADADEHYIWRLRIPFNHVDGPRNYLSKLMRYDSLLEARNSLSHLEEFVSACLDCWTNRVPFGTYNLTNPGAVTTREVVALLQEHLVPEREFQFFQDESQFMQVAAKTPRSNCVLDSQKATDAGIKMRHVTEAIEAALKAWQPEVAAATV